MKTAYVFPGQGSQHPGMGKDLYETNSDAKNIFEKANEVLGFSLSNIMFEGSAEDLKQTKVTQPAIFVHSIAAFQTLANTPPQMVAGHSLGEFSALVACGALKFEDALRLVYQRALAMQEACEIEPSTMAAVLGMDDEKVEQICREISGVVVPANYNCPGQLVISGSISSIDNACKRLLEEGARRALVLPVGGAFHSPLMEPAGVKLQAAIQSTEFNTPHCPIYQNVDAKPSSNIDEIKEKLSLQLTSPVKWTYISKQMISDGLTHLTEIGPGKVLQGLVKKVDRAIETNGVG